MCETEANYCCCHWVDKNFYTIYKEYLKDVLTIADKFEDDNEVIKRLDMITGIYDIEDFNFCTMRASDNGCMFRRIWFKFKEDAGQGHFMHFTKEFYELDCNVNLDTDRIWRKL